MFILIYSVDYFSKLIRFCLRNSSFLSSWSFWGYFIIQTILSSYYSFHTAIPLYLTQLYPRDSYSSETKREVGLHFAVPFLVRRKKKWQHNYKWWWITWNTQDKSWARSKISKGCKGASTSQWMDKIKPLQRCNINANMCKWQKVWEENSSQQIIKCKGSLSR